jgi:oxygen-independent coproporphyrinogen-3 oxidase
MSQIKVDLDLVKKYNVAGPRYTSYPPATQFNTQTSAADIEAEIAHNNQGERDLSLYFHIPFCKTLCWFCGCTTVITNDQKQSNVYVGYLEKEMERMSQKLNPRRQVTQLHWGGGSPTFMTPDDIRRLGQAIHGRFKLAPDAEAGVEIDPRRMIFDHVTALREIGFNRASLGVQDFNPEVQKAVHRIQPPELTREVARWIREAGFTSLNIDLIYGLPYQTPETFEQTLDGVLEMKPDRFAVFSYAHVPWMKPAQKILENKSVLPTPETKLKLLKLVIEKLTGSGYVYIGMDHFARETDELVSAQRNHTLQRNFQGYSTRSESDIYAFGMSAISQTANAYWQNLKELPEYYAALDLGEPLFARGYLLNDDDRLRRQTIMRLMCDLSLDYARMSRLLNLDFQKHFARELASYDDMVADGLLVQTATGLTVTDLGRLFIRNIAMRFDVYLPQMTERRFSRTI